MKKLTAHVIDGYDLQIRPAPMERDWMDATDKHFAYRCLPLNIANAHGWEILCSTPFTATWNGGRGLDAVTVTAGNGAAPPATSHFGDGILTFHVPSLFQTDPGIDLCVTGPVNRPKDGIAALTAMVETDWSPYTFTMNWKFTRPDHPVRFELGEPYCHIFMVQRSALEAAEPDIRPLSQSPELEAEYRNWSNSRVAFNTSLATRDPGDTSEDWQKTYFRGAWPSGRAAPFGHKSKLRLRSFVRK